MYKVVMIYPDGTKEQDDEVFETEEQARAYGLEQCDNYVAGGEVCTCRTQGTTRSARTTTSTST